jgi:NADH-quinone oxidoreductase subunit F
VTVEIRVGLGSCGVASGGEEVWAALAEAAGSRNGTAVLKRVGCNGMCHREPLVEVVDGAARTFYGELTPVLARELAQRHLAPRRLWPWRGRRAAELDTHAFEPDDPGAAAFLGEQRRVVLENCGGIDPLSIDDYLARDGYRALETVLARRAPEEVIRAVEESGLRGRGGAGFPTGRKWAIARAMPGAERYVVCNGDEGDPGAFMDRLVMESDPHRVIEGLAIAAFAIGARTGIFYVRSEYPQAVRHLRAALRQAEERGFLGERILGSDFDLRLEVREGAGAFVCGEETALIASLEGRRGMPRLRPPFPVERGFRGAPTSINNVETLACLPWILRHGPEEFAAMGTETSKGTKVFALAGKVRRGGLVEVPMGLPLRRVVEEIGGGIEGGRAFKAVQIGGPSGGCLPASEADTPIDYEALARSGTIMGSGGLVVLDDTDCMVDISRFFLSFTQSESCGKCTFCRIGTRRMLDVLERMCEGRGRPGDLELLEELGDRVKRASLCGLGQTAPNPVLTTLRFFREEFEAHLDGRCPAGRCPDLIRYRVTEECIGCTLCAQACPVEAIEHLPYERHVVDDELCTRCGMCLAACQDDAVEVVSP